MAFNREINSLVSREFRLEWRNKYTLGGVLLYLAATVFVILTALEQEGLADQMGASWWNLLFWLSMLFICVNAIAKSFSQESEQKTLYLYTLFRPESVILAKMLYNYVFTLFLGTLTWVLFLVWFGNPVIHAFNFFLLILFGGGGLGLVFTMISSIASKAGNNSTLMAILSFPVVLPFVIVLIRLSSTVFSEGSLIESAGLLWAILIALNLLVLGMSFILFPYLWRE